MKPSTTNQPFVPNKKLIIHFDVDNVLTINHPNKDLFVCFALTKGVRTVLTMGVGQAVEGDQRRPIESNMETRNKHPINLTTRARTRQLQRLPHHPRQTITLIAIETAPEHEQRPLREGQGLN